MARLAALVLIALVTAPSIQSQSAPAIRGFTTQSAAVERELERRYQSLPNPENMRQYMRAITQEPHHAGSPGSRKVAEYVLARFKSWGLDASIEEFQARSSRIRTTTGGTSG